jgi:two-component system response regulator NreC
MNRLRILIVDDHEVVRKGIRALLDVRRDWTVVGEAATAADAVKKAKKLKPDVILLDLSLPDMNGIAAIPKIREVWPAAKILVLTMHQSPSLARKALGEGARGLVLKSDATRDLVRALEALARSRSFVSPGVMDLIVDGLAESVKSPVDTLTPRERQILKLLAEGKANKEVAAMLGLSVKTAEAHRANLMHKLDLRSLSDLIHFAIRHHMTQV